MALIRADLCSESLGKDTGCVILMPQKTQINKKYIGRNGKLKCLYLLHGLSDNESAWLRWSSIERYAERYGIAVVMPNADKSFYCDMKHGDKYYEYVAHELPEIIEYMFPVSPEREDRYAAGLSMGGYGAFKLALREPERYAAASALSPVGDIQSFIRSEFAGIHYEYIFGDDRTVPDNDDLLKLAEKNNGLRPKLYLAMGTEDGLYDHCLPLRDKLNELGYDLTCFEGPGNHNWEFWDEHIEKTLKWMLE
ncbi:MAG: esterase family protein [Clostridia bacterium]|nr:esterase family protein [Clostridia bacterium]